MHSLRALLLSATLLSGALALPSCDAAITCTADADCPSGEQCLSGVCDAPVARCPGDAAVCEGSGPSAACGGLECRDGCCARGCTSARECAGDELCLAGLCEPSDKLYCGSDDDCAAAPGTPLCVSVEATCVECFSNADCADGRVCSSARRCVLEAERCLLNADCVNNAEAPLCDDDLGICVQCLANDHCEAGRVCAADHRCRREPARCAQDADCALFRAETPVCETLSARCVGCLVDTDCSADGSSRCNSQSECVSIGRSCSVDSDCGDGRCRTSDGVCVSCLEGADCRSGERCLVDGRCAGGLTCAASADCPSSLVCDSSASACVECVADGDCTSGKCLRSYCVAAVDGCLADADCTMPDRARCDPLTRHCLGRVECVEDGDCASGRSCDDGRCVACRTNEQCPEGVCRDGACFARCRDATDCAGGQFCRPWDKTCAACWTDDHCRVSDKACFSGVRCDRKVGRCALPDYDCGDGNECTTDSCSRDAADASGCLHVSLEENTPCGGGFCRDTTPDDATEGDAVQCVPGCLISGRFVAEFESHPTDKCLFCDPRPLVNGATEQLYRWTAYSCETGGTCEGLGECLGPDANGIGQCAYPKEGDPCDPEDACVTDATCTKVPEDGRQVLRCRGTLKSCPETDCHGPGRCVEGLCVEGDIAPEKSGRVCDDGFPVSCSRCNAAGQCVTAGSALTCGLVISEIRTAGQYVTDEFVELANAGQIPIKSSDIQFVVSSSTTSVSLTRRLFGEDYWIPPGARLLVSGSNCGDGQCNALRDSWSATTSILPEVGAIGIGAVTTVPYTVSDAVMFAAAGGVAPAFAAWSGPLGAMKMGDGGKSYERQKDPSRPLDSNASAILLSQTRNSTTDFGGSKVVSTIQGLANSPVVAVTLGDTSVASTVAVDVRFVKMPSDMRQVTLTFRNRHPTNGVTITEASFAGPEAARFQLAGAAGTPSWPLPLTACNAGSYPYPSNWYLRSSVAWPPPACQIGSMSSWTVTFDPTGAPVTSSAELVLRIKQNPGRTPLINSSGYLNTYCAGAGDPCNIGTPTTVVVKLRAER